ncbi:uncharacterized protein LOC113211869 isoform X2 [Frankliniella occidentalis]|uniref:Uncharacterized protein LOC113211869 isoform X2 n=1 Tax=Frankliniella occidentalis TaxID=133901 RepID=A0A6J1SZ02_FRAOC|nr:uncharacterized protein LOC113211869 isoform X2 [Frankliniella occidentalis]
MASKTFILFAAVAVALLSVATAKHCEGGRLDILEAMMDVCSKYVTGSRWFIPSLCSGQVINELEKQPHCSVKDAVKLMGDCFGGAAGRDKAEACLQSAIDSGVCC